MRSSTLNIVEICMYFKGIQWAKKFEKKISSNPWIYGIPGSREFVGIQACFCLKFCQRFVRELKTLKSSHMRIPILAHSNVEKFLETLINQVGKKKKSQRVILGGKCSLSSRLHTIHMPSGLWGSLCCIFIYARRVHGMKKCPYR